MSANKLFIIGLVVVIVLYFVAVGFNAFHGDESPSDYQTEEQQSSLVEPYKNNDGLRVVADFFESFATEIDIFAEIASNDPPSPDRCKVVGTGKEQAIVLSDNDVSCLVNLPRSADGYRKTTLSFNYNEPGTATRSGALKTLMMDRPQLGQLHRIPPHHIVTATAERLEITLMMNENPKKPGVKEIKANQNQKIAFREEGGQLKLTCRSCSRSIYVRAE